MWNIKVFSAFKELNSPPSWALVKGQKSKGKNMVVYMPNVGPRYKY